MKIKRRRGRRDGSGGFFRFYSSVWDWGDSSYQNTCEFIAALTGLALLLTAARSHEQIDSVSFRGDSEVALTWMDKQKSESSMASRACSVLALMVTRNNIRINYVEHVPAAQNEECDRLSRDELVISVFGTSVPDLTTTSPVTVEAIFTIHMLNYTRLYLPSSVGHI
jgi:ribonuclease HI